MSPILDTYRTLQRDHDRMVAFLRLIAEYQTAAWADNPDQQRAAFALAARSILRDVEAPR